MATEKKTTKPAAKKPAPKKAAEATEVKAAAPVATDTRNPIQKRRVVEGVVLSNKMQKTIVVRVDRRVKNPFYKKYVVVSRKFKAHDEKNEANVGDRVQIVESRPLSKDKRWALQSIVRRAGQAPEANV